MFRHANDEDALPYENAVVQAIQGGKDAVAYVTTGDDLGIQVEIYPGVPIFSKSVESQLDSFSHALTIVFADRSLVGRPEEAFWDCMEKCWKHTVSSAGRHAMLVIAMDERVGDAFSAKRSELAKIQLMQATQLGERAIRPSMFALRTLHELRMLLARGLQEPSHEEVGHLRLFISHAKIDGLPLAHALKRLIESLTWLQKFYDADDLPTGGDWQSELEKGVGSSLIVMLRTDIYEARYWCQQEVYWADEYATPAVLVDARTKLNYPATSLPFDRVPTIRIPDGNLIRILFLALRESLRFLYFKRKIKNLEQDGTIPSPVEMRVFSFQPSMAALLRACSQLAATTAPEATPRVIIYPDPPFRKGTYEAAHALVGAYAKDVRLVTPNTVIARGGKL